MELLGYARFFHQVKKEREQSEKKIKEVQDRYEQQRQDLFNKANIEIEQIRLALAQAIAKLETETEAEQMAFDKDQKWENEELAEKEDMLSEMKREIG